MPTLAAIRERRLKVGGLGIAGLERAADADAPRVLCLHGWLDNAASFLPLACAARVPMRLFALDLPGHGHSEHSPGHYRLADTMIRVVELLDVLGWDDCHLVGHSLGACVAPLLAASVPERILSLFLIDAIGPPTEPPSAIVDRLRRATQTREPHRTNRRFADPAAAVEARRRAVRMASHSARLIVERQLVRDGSDWTWRFDPTLREPTPVYLTEGQVRAILRAAECPAALVVASDGYLRGRDGIDGRCEVMSRLDRFDVAGHHHVHMDRPASIAAILDRWLLSGVKGRK